MSLPAPTEAREIRGRGGYKYTGPRIGRGSYGIHKPIPTHQDIINYNRDWQECYTVFVVFNHFRVAGVFMSEEAADQYEADLNEGKKDLVEEDYLYKSRMSSMCLKTKPESPLPHSPIISDTE